MENNAVKRELTVKVKKGLSVKDIILVAVLLAAGAVLKFFVGQFVNIGGMKPNFIIAMYCLAIMLIKPKPYEAAVIGLLAGAVCQLFPGTPYLNFASELLGALAMSLLILLPLQIGKLNLRPAICTFISTVVSGGSFVVGLIFVLGAETATLIAYIPIVLGTALINCIIVSLLYIPLKAVLDRNA